MNGRGGAAFNSGPKRATHTPASANSREFHDAEPADGSLCGLLGRALAADYPTVSCNRQARHKWGPGGGAIPDQLRGDPGQWTSINLPAEIADHLGSNRLDLTEPSARRRALPHLLETGPADVVATILTLPQLRREWPHLELSDLLRDAWEDTYPALADDIGITDHRSRSANAAG